MSDIIIPLILALIICLIFNKPLEELSNNLADKSELKIKQFKENYKIKQKLKNKKINISNTEENKLEPTFKNIATFYLSILFIIILGLIIGINIGFEYVLLIIAIYIFVTILQLIILSPYRGIIISILFIGTIIIAILLYVHRYDIMLYQIIDDIFSN